MANGCISHPRREDSITSGGSVFPMANPQQFTSGLTEEEGIAMAPDGRSFVTAVALQSASIWIHDARGERQISLLEGNAAYPKFTPDGKKLCYRIVKAVPRFTERREIQAKCGWQTWTPDIPSAVAPGFQPLDYDISPDGQQVVMEAPDGEGKPRLWLAPFDRRSPPRQIPDVEGRRALYLAQAAKSSSAEWKGPPGLCTVSGRTARDCGKRWSSRLLCLIDISPDGRWIWIWGPLPGQQRRRAASSRSTEDLRFSSAAIPSCSGRASGDSLWISGGAVPDGRTYIVPLPPGRYCRRYPGGGFRSEQEIAASARSTQDRRHGAPGPSSTSMLSSVTRPAEPVPHPDSVKSPHRSVPTAFFATERGTQTRP